MVTLAVHAALALAAGAAQADDAEQKFFVGGFGTIGATHSSLERGDYVSSTFQKNGAGYSRDWDFGVDSKLALQLDGKFSDQWTAVLQVVAIRGADGKFAPHIEWANIKYAFSPSLSVRVGRTSLPTYMVADSRQVGFTTPWVRPPVETYSLNPISHANGVDASWRVRSGTVTNTVQSWYGKTEVDIVGQRGTITHDVKATRLYGIADTIEYGALTARAGILLGKFEINAAPGLVLKPDYRLLNLGATYDPGEWFVQGEYSHMKNGNASRASKAFYVTAGYRIAQLTPYATYSEVRPDDNQVRLTTRDQETVALGLRWDAVKNVAVKVQLDRVKLAPGNLGFFTNAQPGLAGSSGNVGSVAVDFIY